MKYTRQITCCFTGHRPQKLPWGCDENDRRCIELKHLLSDLLASLYESGYRRYLCGMAAGTDLYCGEAVVALRDEHPDVFLEAAVPFDGQERRWSRELRARYARLASECDAVTILRESYAPGCMMARNRYMVDRSSLLVAVYDGRPGGTKNTMEYAYSQGLRILHLPTDMS